MRPAPLIVQGYHVEHLSFSVNPHYDLEAPTLLGVEDVKVESALEELVFPSGNSWEIRMQVVQNVAAEKNAPYNFAIVIQGLFTVAEGFPNERSRRLVETNGSSILYGTCREIIRSATSQGPYQALLLPTLSFYEPETPDVPSPGREEGIAPA